MLEEYTKIIEKIKDEREYLKIYQYEMANELDIDERTYRSIEKGASKLNMLQFLAICKKLNKTPDYFFEGMNNYHFNNCSNSGNHNVYNINEVNKESLRLLIDTFQEKLNSMK